MPRRDYRDPFTDAEFRRAVAERVAPLDDAPDPHDRRGYFAWAAAKRRAWLADGLSVRLTDNLWAVLIANRRKALDPTWERRHRRRPNAPARYE